MKSIFLILLLIGNFAFAQVPDSRNNIDVGEIAPSKVDMEADTEIPFAIVETKPVFPGCEKLESQSEMEKCFFENLQLFISKNLKYPKDAKKQKLEGRVFVACIITKEGDFKLVGIRNVPNAPMLGDETKRIFDKLPKVKPGMQRGENIDVQLAFPVVFKLVSK